MKSRARDARQSLRRFHAHDWGARAHQGNPPHLLLRREMPGAASAARQRVVLLDPARASLRDDALHARRKCAASIADQTQHARPPSTPTTKTAAPSFSQTTLATHRAKPAKRQPRALLQPSKTSRHLL